MANRIQKFQLRRKSQKRSTDWPKKTQTYTLLIMHFSGPVIKIPISRSQNMKNMGVRFSKISDILQNGTDIKTLKFNRVSQAETLLVENHIFPLDFFKFRT